MIRRFARFSIRSERNWLAALTAQICRYTRPGSRSKRRSCYDFNMTTVEILYRYTTPPTDRVSIALAGARDVYGIRHLEINSEARRLRVEFDATRLNSAAVTKLIRQTGLQIAEELPLIPAVVTAPEA